MPGPNTKGLDRHFFRKVNITETDFPSESQIFINIKGQKSFTMVNEGGNVIEYSFNGNTLHGDMTPSTPTAALSFDDRAVSTIFFRAAAPSVVRIEAWA